MPAEPLCSCHFPGELGCCCLHRGEEVERLLFALQRTSWFLQGQGRSLRAATSQSDLYQRVTYLLLICSTLPATAHLGS